LPRLISRVSDRLIFISGRPAQAQLTDAQSLVPGGGSRSAAIGSIIFDA